MRHPGRKKIEKRKRLWQTCWMRGKGDILQTWGKGGGGTFPAKSHRRKKNKEKSNTAEKGGKKKKIPAGEVKKNPFAVPLKRKRKIFVPVPQKKTARILGLKKKNHTAATRQAQESA